MIFTLCRERGRNKPGIGNVPDPFRVVIKWRPDGSGLRQTIQKHVTIPGQYICTILHPQEMFLTLSLHALS